jgi:hypothetical protein
VDHELRAAAERYKAWTLRTRPGRRNPYIGLAVGWREDVLSLADAYLAEHPPEPTDSPDVDPGSAGKEQMPD